MICISKFIFDGLIEIKRTDNPIELSKSSYSISIIIILTLMCLTIIGSLFFDTITAFDLSSKMYQIQKIKEKDLLDVSKRFKKIKINNILKFSNIYKYYLIFIIINIINIIICIYLYTDIDEKNFENWFTLYNYFSYILRIYHSIILVLLIISIITMNISKKILLKKQYYNPDRIAQKLYDIHFSQVVYFTDILSFKLVSDLIMNIPPLIFLSLGQFNTITLIFSEFVIFLYIFLGGNQNLIIDKDTKAGKLSKIVKYWFCFKYLDFHFGEKDHRMIFDEFNFTYSQEEQNIFKSLNLTIIKNIENNLFDLDDNWKEYENNGTILGLNDSYQNINQTEEIKDKKIIDFKIVSEFYIIQKLMMLYFKLNQKVYESTVENNNQNLFAFKKLGQDRKNKKIFNSQNKEIFITNIDRISRMSIREIKKIKPSLKISQEDIFTTIEEKELFEELKNKLKLNNEKYIYKIESLLSSELFELFPFYQMNILSIIKSLNPSRNIKIFDKFVKRNNNIPTNFRISNLDKRISVKSYKTNKITNNNLGTGKIETKKELEKNLFYTYDLYLMYEIYDKNDFINLDELQKIISEYNAYMISTVKNMNYSFLPLILGIFSLEVYDSNKIIVLYRNPLYFTIFNHFNHWINFYITEEPEKIRVSSLFNDVIDVNEIEIRNSLQLNEGDYDEITQILEKDYSFLKKVKNIYPVIHLFIGDENNDDMIEENGEGNESNQKIKKNKNQYNENSILGELSINKDIGLVDVLDKNLSLSNMNNTDDENDLNNIIDQNSLFDKEYYYMSGKDIRTIKIYFTNLFRNDCELNKIQENLINKINSDSYCEYLQGQLIKYLNKNSLFNDEIIDENDENK